jgi:predicted MFS family arabinose efflux permease
MLGSPLSLVIGYFMAGWLNEFYGWRVTLVVLGLPGLALAALAWLTLCEPRNDRCAQGEVSRPARSPKASTQPSLLQVCATLWANSTFRHLLFAFAVMSFFGYGIGQWQSAFFLRSYELETGELGTWLAVVYGAGGLIGTYWGGALASARAARNERLQLRTMAVVLSSFGVLSAMIYCASIYKIAFGLMFVSIIGGAAINGPLFATIQTLVPENMRAQSIAFIYLFANLIGMGLGPLAVGVVSDLLRPVFADESLRYALLLLSPGYLWASWHLWQASKSVIGDLEYALREQRSGVQDGGIDASAARSA